MTATAPAATLDADEHRRIGVDLFNHVWTLLEKQDRTPAEPSLWHARRALALCGQHHITDFFLGAAYEGLARALRVAGDHAEAERYSALARAVGDRLEDAEDRETLFGDLDSIRA